MRLRTSNVTKAETQHAGDRRVADQLARSAADHDEHIAQEAMNLANRAFARLERMESCVTGL